MKRRLKTLEVLQKAGFERFRVTLSIAKPSEHSYWPDNYSIEGSFEYVLQLLCCEQALLL